MAFNIENEIAVLKTEIRHLDNLIQTTDETMEVYGRSQLSLLREARESRIGKVAFLRGQSLRS